MQVSVLAAFDYVRTYDKNRDQCDEPHHQKQVAVFRDLFCHGEIFEADEGEEDYKW